MTATPENEDQERVVSAATAAASSLRLMLETYDAPVSLADRLREAYLQGALHALEALVACDEKALTGLLDGPSSPSSGGA